MNYWPVVILTVVITVIVGLFAWGIISGRNISREAAREIEEIESL